MLNQGPSAVGQTNGFGPNNKQGQANDYGRTPTKRNGLGENNRGSQGDQIQANKGQN